MTAAVSSGNSEIAGVQYMRAAAAIFVVYFHTTVYNEQFVWFDSLPRAFGAGGVDIFFVISGFIMMLVTAGKPITPAQFLYRRVTRIVPLYWGVTLVVAAMGLAYPAAMLNNEVSARHLLLSMAFLPHANPVTGAITPFFKLGWTLNYEMYFYVLFAGLLLSRAPGRRLALLAAYAAAVSVFFLFDDPQIAALRVYTNPIIGEFVMGAAAGYAFTTGVFTRMPARVAISLIALATIVIVASPVEDETRLFLQGAAGAAALCGVLGLEASGRMPRIGWLVLLGNASYSIYLVHPIVESVMRLFARLAHLPIETLSVGAPLVVLATLGSIGGGIAVYLLLEAPMIAWFKQRATLRGGLKTLVPSQQI